MIKSQTMAEQFTTVDRWVPVVGLWDVEQDSATYKGVPEATGQSISLATSHGIALSEVQFDGGHVKTTVSLAARAGSARILLGYRSRDSRYVTAGIGGSEEAYVIEEFDPSAGWRRLADAGRIANLTLNQPCGMEVGLEGQRITLTVDNIKVLDHVLSQPLEREQVGIFAAGPGQVHFNQVEVSTNALSAFVVMQFTSPFDELYEEVIHPVCADAGIEAYRVSDIYRPGVILQDIIQGLAESDVIIAEITSANPNVFYELGYAHALNKQVIVLAERDTTLPFDVRGYRVIFYENAIRGKSSLEAELRHHLKSIFGQSGRSAREFLR